MTPPNDAARPVAKVTVKENGTDCSLWIDRNAIEVLTPGEEMPLYTAADYDALRAEVDALRSTYNGLCYSQVEFDAACLEALKFRARAEAAEAKLAELEDKAVLCTWSYDIVDDAWNTTCGHKHQFMAGGPAENHHRFCPYCSGDLDAALNEGDGE